MNVRKVNNLQLNLGINLQQIKIAVITITLMLVSNINAQNLFINEFMASNVISTPEIVDYDDYSDWIEIYNDSTETINLSGYYLTDDLTNPTKWQIPEGTKINGKGYLIFWADGYNDSPDNNIKYYHLNFKLKKGGESIGLFSPEEVRIDSVIFGTQIPDVSYGRQPNGGSDWYYFGESTPAESNLTTGITNTEFSSLPDILLPSGIYSENQSVTIGTIAGGDIRYTLDGSMPKSSSPKYVSSLNINSTTTLRVRTFEVDKLPSKIITRSYFINEVQNLPILSLTAFPETLFDNEIGIYTNEIKGREIPANIQLFEMEGEFAFEVDASIRLSGQASFQFPQKSFTVESDDKFGSDFINYSVFENRPFNKYKSIYLRNSGYYDNQHTMFRDALQHTIVINQMDLDCIAYRPAATYINGEYWGIYNIREKFDKNYLIAHHRIDPKNIDYLEYEFSATPNVIEGNTDAYYALQNYLSNNSMNIPENWEYVKSQIDVSEVMNYLITEIYCDNVNWPNTNSRWWKEKTESGKWRYIFLDSDYGFGAPSWFSHYSNNTMQFLYDSQPYSTFVFRKLFENNDFKNEFIQRFASRLNTTFHKDRVVGIVDSLKNQINVEMVNHIDRWKNSSPSISDIDDWNEQVQIMREFADKRPEHMKQNLIDFYNLSGTENINFSLSNSNSGKISIAGVNITDGLVGEYFRYVPMKIEAVPSIGYKFVKWIGVKDSLSSSTFYTPLRSESTINITAVFEEDNNNILPSIISVNTTLDVSGSPYLAKGDVKISSGINLTIESGVEILMPEGANIIVNGTLEMNGTEEQPIIVKPNETSGFNKWGIIYLDSTSGQCKIDNVELIGATHGKLLPNQVGAISSYKSDVVIENTTILDAPFPIFIQFGNAIIRNCKLHSEKTSDLINIKYAETALVENCDLRGNNSPDTDAIDYDNILDGAIKGNRIYNFYGFNSDGIDLGEGSKNILIESNLIFNISDKGISVGQASTTNIKKNIIVNCTQGIGVKDNLSFAFIDRNTFWGCDYSVAVFEKNLGSGGGNAEIINSIFSQSVISPTFVDNLSTLTVSYSLSDTKILEGSVNIKGNPFFVNNFILSSSSPAIDAGNPQTELDTDGSIADLGAKYFNGEYESLLINEIHYNPDIGDEYEFIELYNTSSNTIDISGYKLGGVIDFMFPNNVSIDANEYLLIKKDIPIVVPGFSWGEPSLPNTGGNIILFNDLGEEIDFVSYGNKNDWPSAANGAGHSLELKNPLDENLITTHWKASSSFGGSPGKANKLNLSDQIFINEFQTNNKNIIKDEFEEYDDWIEIYNTSDNPINLGELYITDDFLNLTKHQIGNNNDNKNTIAPKKHLLLWADENTNQGINHLNFKLKSGGEELALVYVFENDTTIIDSISFGQQEKNFSYARLNDGDENWHIAKAPTPNEKNSNANVLKNGILLVNGFKFGTPDVDDSYENKAFWGEYNISFWDLLGSKLNPDYPNTLPNPIGYGAIPIDTLSNYSTVIWTGVNSTLEKNFWNNSSALKYVKMGGNLILMFKNGRDYIKGEMLKRLGINWADPENANIKNCVPIYEGLDSISIKSAQYQSSVFDTALTNSNSKLLFTETVTYGKPLGIGVWNKPPYGGWYKENGGQIVFLSGRAYRYGNEELKNNLEYIFKTFLEETIVSVDDDKDNQLITEYSLSQNYPNPFNPTTAIKYDLVKKSKVDLRIYNILGQEVITLVNKLENKGSKTVLWNGRDNFNKKVSSGIYFYRISAGNWSDIKKMILLK